MKQFILLLFILVLSACGKDTFADETVTYIVETTSKDYSVSYFDGCGFEEAEDLSGNWKYTFNFTTTDSSGAYAYLSARNGYNSDKLTLKILINGKVVKQKSCTGIYCIVQEDYESNCGCR